MCNTNSDRPKSGAMFAAILALFTLLNTVQAAPIYYTFEGTVGSSNYDLIAEDYGLGPDTAVSYTFMVDTALDGYVTQDGVVTTFIDVAGGYNYFYVDYIGGSEISDQYGTYNEFNVGNTGLANLLRGGNNVFVLDLNHGRSLADWFVGDDMFLVYDYWTVGNVTYDLDASVSLTRVSDINPYASVAEPGSLFLLGMGLFGIGFTRHRIS